MTEQKQRPLRAVCACGAKYQFKRPKKGKD